MYSDNQQISRARNRVIKIFKDISYSFLEYEKDLEGFRLQIDVCHKLFLKA